MFNELKWNGNCVFEYESSIILCSNTPVLFDLNEILAFATKLEDNFHFILYRSYISFVPCIMLSQTKFSQ